MAFTKITSADLDDKGVIGLPDTPELSTTEMQEKFDEIALDVLVPAHNTLVDELDSAFEGVEGDIDGKADKATTLAGYGITDAKIESGTITLGSNSITPITDVSGKMNKANPTFTGNMTGGTNVTVTGDYTNGNGETLHGAHTAISGKADKATTLAGYGITDAQITTNLYGENTITLGSNSVKVVEYNNPKATGRIELGTGASASSVLGMNSIAIGKDANANPFNSMAIGNGAIASDAAQVVLGDYNVTDSTSKLIIGGGSANDDRRTLLKFDDSTGDATFCAEVTDGSGNVLSDKANKTPFTRDADGLVPKSGSATTYKYLCSDGTWSRPADESVAKKDITGLDYDYDLLLTGHESGDRTGNALHSTDIYFNAREKDLHVKKINGVIFDNILPVDTESGNPAVITDAFGGACKSLKLTLEPIQSGSGTPSPSNPLPISGRTQVEITRCGKNLTDMSTYVQGGFDNGIPQQDISSRVSSYTYIPVIEGETYTLNAKTSISEKTVKGVLIYYTNNTNDYSGTTGNSGFKALPAQYTIPSGVKYICIGIGLTDDTNLTPSQISDVQFEIGSTATDYEAYNGETITRTYGTTIYGGTDDVTGDGVTVTRVKESFNWADGTNTTILGSYTRKQFKTTYPAVYPPSEGKPQLSDIAPYNAHWSEQSTHFYVNDETISNNVIMVLPTDTSATTFDIVYEPVTPISIPLTAQNITLLKGDNVLTTDADSIEASYSADIALYIEKKIAEGSNNRSVNTLSLTKGGLSETESEDTKSIAPDTKDVLIKTDSSESEER